MHIVRGKTFVKLRERRHRKEAERKPLPTWFSTVDTLTTDSMVALYKEYLRDALLHDERPYQGRVEEKNSSRLEIFKKYQKINSSNSIKQARRMKF